MEGGCCHLLHEAITCFLQLSLQVQVLMMLENNLHKNVIRIAVRVTLAQRNKDAYDSMLDLIYDAQT